MDDNSITTAGTIIDTASTTTTTTATVTNTSSICYFDNQYEHGVAGILITHVSISLAILGIPANLLTLIILKRDTSTNSGTSTTLTSTSRNATNFILATLATEDILIIILYNLYYVAIHYYEKYYKALKYLGLLRYADSPIYFLLNWIKVAEIYTIVLLSLQRYLAIRWPLRSAYLCSLGRTKRIIYGIFILALLLKLPNLILGYRIMVPANRKSDDDYQQRPLCDNYTLEDVFLSEKWYKTFTVVYVKVVDQVITFIIPLNILIILNIGLILRVKQATIQRLRENSTVQYNNNNNNNNNKSNMSNALHASKRYSINNEQGFIENKTVSKYLIKPRNSQDLLLSLKATNTDGNIHSATTISLSSTSGGSGINSQVTLSSPTIVSTLHNQQHYQPPAPLSHQHQQHHHQHHHTHTQSRSVTLTLIGVITTFILCETPTTICFCYEIWNTLTEDSQTDEVTFSNNTVNTTTTTTNNNNNSSTLTVNKPDFYYYAYPAALICILIGCASNFFIYILIGRKFRRMCIMYFIEVYGKMKNRFNSCYHLLCCLAKHKQEQRHPCSHYNAKFDNHQKSVTNSALNKHHCPSSGLLSWNKKSKQINCKHKLGNYRHKHHPYHHPHLQHHKQQSRRNHHYHHHRGYQHCQKPQQEDHSKQREDTVQYEYKAIQRSDISVPTDSSQLCVV